MHHKLGETLLAFLVKFYASPYKKLVGPDDTCEGLLPGTLSGFDLGSGLARFSTLRKAAVLARMREWMYALEHLM